MNVKVILFAAARDLCESSEVQVQLSEPATIADLKLELTKRFPQLEPILCRSAISVDHQYANDRFAIEESNEIAIIPPVSGG